MHDSGYACCFTKGVHKRIYRLILKLHGSNLQGHQVDHKDGTRVCTSINNKVNGQLTITYMVNIILWELRELILLR